MREYTIEGTDKKILLKSTRVWHEAAEMRLLGLRNATIYMHYRAWRRASSSFMYQCKLRNIEVIVVY